MHNLPLQLKATSTSLSKIIILVLAGNNCHLLFFYCTIADNTMRTSCFSSDNTTLKASHWLNCTNFAICDTPVNFSQSYPHLDSSIYVIKLNVILNIVQYGSTVVCHCHTPGLPIPYLCFVTATSIMPFPHSLPGSILLNIT